MMHHLWRLCESNESNYRQHLNIVPKPRSMMSMIVLLLLVMCCAVGSMREVNTMYNTTPTPSFQPVS